MGQLVFSHLDAFVAASAALLASGLAWLQALHTSRRLKRSEVTSQLIHIFFGLDSFKTRYEVLKIAKTIFVEGDESVLRLLINEDFTKYDADLPPPGEDGLRPIHSLLHFLYFFVEITANYDMGLVEKKVIRRALASQYEFWRDLLVKIEDFYQRETTGRHLATPPWAEMLPKLDALMEVSQPSNP